MLEPYWRSGGLTLYVGDCLEILGQLPERSVDLLATDPPYSSGGAFRGDRAGKGPREKYGHHQRPERYAADFSGDNRDQHSYGFWCTLWLSMARRLARPGAAALVFTDWRQLPVTTDALQAGGWVWRGVAVWDKKRGRPFRGRFAHQAEYVVWGSSGAMTADRGPTLPGVFRYAPEGRRRFHQAQKPEALMADLMQVAAWKRPRGRRLVVLDPFAGGGSTLAAAHRLGLDAIGIELDRRQAAIAKRRLVELLAGNGNGQPAPRRPAASDGRGQSRPPAS